MKPTLANSQVCSLSFCLYTHKYYQIETLLSVRCPDKRNPPPEKLFKDLIPFPSIKSHKPHVKSQRLAEVLYHLKWLSGSWLGRLNEQPVLLVGGQQPPARYLMSALWNLSSHRPLVYMLLSGPRWVWVIMCHFFSQMERCITACRRARQIDNVQTLTYNTFYFTREQTYSIIMQLITGNRCCHPLYTPLGPPVMGE